MNIDIEIKNPVFATEDNSMINIELNHPTFGWIPFTASAIDPESYGRAIYQHIIDGNVGTIQPYQPIEQQVNTVE